MAIVLRNSPGIRSYVFFYYFGMFPIFFVFFRQIIGQFFNSEFDDILLLIFVAIFFSLFLHFKKGEIRKPHVSFVLFFSSCLTSLVINLSMDRVIFQFYGLYSFLKNYLFLYIGFAIALSCSDRIKYYKIFVILSVIPSILIIIQNLFPGIHNDLIFRDYGEVLPYLSYRKSAFFSNPSIVARLLGTAATIAIFLHFVTGYKRFIVYFVMFFFGVAGTYSRGPFVAMLLSVSVVICIYYRANIIKKMLVMVVALCLTFTFFVSSTVWKARFIETKQQLSIFEDVYRVQAYTSALSVLLDYPLFGAGPGTFGSAISGRSNSPIEQRYGFTASRFFYGQHGPQTSDAYWPHFFAEYGAVGFVFLSFIFYSLARSKFKYNGNDIDRWMVMALIIQLCFSSLTSFELETASSGLLILYFSGLFLGGRFEGKHIISCYYRN